MVFLGGRDDLLEAGLDLLEIRQSILGPGSLGRWSVRGRSRFRSGFRRRGQQFRDVGDAGPGNGGSRRTDEVVIAEVAGRGPSEWPAHFARARAPGDRRERYPSWPRLPPLLSWRQAEVIQGLIARSKRKEDFILCLEVPGRRYGLSLPRLRSWPTRP